MANMARTKTEIECNLLLAKVIPVTIMSLHLAWYMKQVASTLKVVA